MRSRSTTPQARTRPLVNGTVSRKAATGLAALAALRGVAISRLLENGIELVLETATPEERAAIAARAT